jgi:hypothetical protein
MAPMSLPIEMSGSRSGGDHLLVEVGGGDPSVGVGPGALRIGLDLVVHHESFWVAIRLRRTPPVSEGVSRDNRLAAMNKQFPYQVFAKPC